MTPYPKTILIGTSTICQYGCIFCNNPREGLIPKVSLGVDAIIGMLKGFESAELVDISGYGELTIHPDFPRLVNELTKLKIPFSMSTNGEALNLEKQGLLRESSLNRINFSLNSLNPQVQSFLTGGKGHLLVVLAHLGSFSEKPRAYKVFISMVVNRHNFREMPAFVKFAHALGLDGVRFAAPVKVVTYPEGFDLRGDTEERESLAEAHRIARNLGVVLSGMSCSSGGTSSKIPITKCRSPWNMTGINPDGSVTPCCFLPFYVVGNINREKFSDIWDGEKMTALRSAITAGDNRICKNCMEFA